MGEERHRRPTPDVLPPTLGERHRHMVVAHRIPKPDVPSGVRGEGATRDDERARGASEAMSKCNIRDMLIRGMCAQCVPGAGLRDPGLSHEPLLHATHGRLAHSALRLRLAHRRMHPRALPPLHCVRAVPLAPPQKRILMVRVHIRGRGEARREECDRCLDQDPCRRSRCHAVHYYQEHYSWLVV